MTSDVEALGRLRDLTPVAVIDIGSNSVRLVVYEGATRSPTPLFNEKVLCGLGRSLATTGQLSEESVARALRALRRFRAIAGQIGANGVHAIATAAAREAENGKDFIEQAEAILDTKIDVLTGKREAQLAASGVISGMHEVDGVAADLGGGSLEIINIKSQKFAGGVTLPLGSLRLLDLSKGDYVKAAKFVDSHLDGVDWLKKGKGRPFYAVGGTWRAFARLHMAQTRYPLSVMHGYRISVDEALKFSHLLDHLSPSSLEGIEEVSKARRETVPFGAVVMERLIRRIRPSELVLSLFGVREGLFYKLLPEAEKGRDPLLAACEDLAVLRSRSPEHARELGAWSDVLFESPGPKESDQERRLRHAACLLSDIGWRTHSDHRAEHSLKTIAHGAFAGVDHPGRAFLALTVNFRHIGLVKDDMIPPIKELVDERTLKRARIVGAAVRAGHMLSASMPGVVSHTPVSYDGDKLVLHIPERFAMLAGERLERRFHVLANELDRTPEIRIGEDAARLAG